MAETRTCPDCEKGECKKTIEKQAFLYGYKQPTQLTAMVPVWTCQQCGFAFTDGEGEEARSQAVIHYRKTGAVDYP
jgi:rubredoxin